MTRRCSVMRMPLDAHKASMSFALVAVATMSLRRATFSTNVVTSRVEEQALRHCDLFDPDNRLRGGRHRGIRHAHRACGQECCPRQLQGTRDAHRYPQDGADAGP